MYHDIVSLPSMVLRQPRHSYPSNPRPVIAHQYPPGQMAHGAKGGAHTEPATSKLRLGGAEAMSYGKTAIRSLLPTVPRKGLTSKLCR